MLASGQLMAAGLGKLSVMSAMGQPLRAEIELLSVQPDEIGTIEAKLASAEAFRQARIERAMGLSDLQITVDKRANGQPVVRITSATPVNDPFVDLLIELNWSSGRILREYTVLLDPVRDSKPAEPARAAPVLPTASPVAAPAEPAARPAQVAASAAKPAVADTGDKTYGPVKAGETLRAIAAKVAPPDVSIDMMVAALYQANQDAFARNNLNLLKRGKVLNVPDRDAAMLANSPSQARKLIEQHSAAWHEMQNRVADQAARNVAEPARQEPAGKGKIVAAKPEQKPAEATPAKDVLKLSKGEPAKADGKSAQRVQALEEEVAAKARALQEAQDRVNQLEKTVQDLQKLMELKAKAGAPAPAEKSGPAAAPAVAQPEPPKPEKPQVKAPVEVPAEEPGFLSSLLANPLYLGGAIAALVLAGLLWIVMLGKRRRKGLSNFEQSVMTGGDQFKTSIFKTTGGKTERSTVTQSGVATDFSRLGLGSIDTHEVDPIAEAEVYMAYGRDAQAEEILKEALSKDPGRSEIVLKLLEIYATRQDTASFETQASELYANLGDPTSTAWQKAAEMGRKLDPNNPLYRVFGEAPSVPAGVSDLDDLMIAEPEPMAETSFAPESEPEAKDETQSVVEQAAVGMPSQEALPDLEFEVAPAAELEPVESAFDEVKEYPAFGVSAEPPLQVEEEAKLPDFDAEGLMELPEEPGPVELSSPAAEEPELAVGLDELTELTELELPEPELSTVVPDQLPELDFSGIDLELEAPAEEPAPEAAAVEAPALDMPPDIDPDLLEEVNTKLDLARAYLEMGDKEGAREILEEVLKEGDGQQKQEAEKLINSL